MKLVGTVLVFAGLFTALGVSDASAAWTCGAESRGRVDPGHHGWAKREREADARLIALYECAKRTPRWRKCRIVFCKRS